MFKQLSIALIAFLFSTLSYSQGPIIRGCLTCTEIQKTELAKQIGANENGTKINPIVNNVYIFNPNDDSIRHYIVTSSEKWMNGEPTPTVTIVNAAVDDYISGEIKSALTYLRQTSGELIDSTMLHWGSYEPITSAHDIARDNSLSTILRLASQSYMNPAGIRSDIFAKSLANAFGLGWNNVRTIIFPDGTTIKIKLSAINEDSGTNEVSFEIQVDVESAKDGDVPIPISLGQAERVRYLDLAGEQLDRFLATAASYGIPISNRHLKFKVCYRDAGQIVCRKTTPR